MHARYPKKFLADGSPNPAWKPDIRKRLGNRHRTGYVQPNRKKPLPDNNLKPVYLSRKNEHQRKTEFITIDGEGITLENGEQRYVLLAASSSPDDYLIKPEGLSTQDCFDFLCDLAKKHPQGIFVCFGTGYDVNHMLRDLTKAQLQELWQARDHDPEHQSVNYSADKKRKYSLSYRPRKSFHVRRFGTPQFWPYVEAQWRDANGQRKKRTKTCLHADATPEEQEQLKASILKEEQPRNNIVYMEVKKRPNNDGRCVLWDVFGFFQTSFVEALGGKNGYFNELIQERVINGVKHRILVFPDGLEIDLTRMQHMKQQRSSFSREQLENEILPYCRDEVEVLARLMTRLRELFKEAGLTLSRWDGAGAAAAALLQREGIKQYLQEEQPAGLLQAQRSAYAGGRIELGQFGSYVGPVYNYDLNSAYPAAAITLPSLTGGHWRKVKGSSTQPYSLSHVKWYFADELPYYPFFYRDQDGSIYFPSEGEGWYWKPEIDAAMRALESGKLSTKQEAGTIQILESWEFTPATDKKPFAFISALYEQRATWKREGNAAQEVLKFTINSIYGKTAQSLGGTESQPPTYHNIGWAGYMTSHTRASILDVLMQAPEKIIMSTVDGVYSTIPLDVPISDKLGEWKGKQIDGIIAVQSGIYWGLTRLGREPTAEEQATPHFKERFLFWRKEWFAVNPHYRGFNKGSLTAEMCLDAWKAYYKNSRKTAPSTFFVPATRFVGLGSALSSDELWNDWRHFRTIERMLDLLPNNGKRRYAGMGRPPAHEHLCQTYTYTPHGVRLHKASATYKPKWGDRQEMEKKIDGVSQEQVEMELWESTL